MDGYRLSPQQARLWPAYDTPDAPHYRARCLVRIEGTLRREDFEAALARVIARHELLRTTLERLPAMTLPLQVIGTTGQVSCEYLDARDGAALTALTHAPRRSADNALHLALARHADDLHLLALDCAAPWGDTLGLRNLVQELALACTGAPPELAEPLQYADLAEWQCELLEQPTAEMGRDFWRRQDLAHAVTQRLPLAAAGAARFAPAHIDIDVAALAAPLAHAAATAGVPPRAVLLAAWQCWLARVCGADEVVIGVSCDGRGYDELTAALGLVARDVPGHASYDGKLDLLAAARRVDAALTAQERWQECYGFELTQGDPTYLPFGFEFHPAPAPILVAQYRWRIEQEDCCLERNDARLVAHARAEGALTLGLRYDSHVLDLRAARRAAQGFRALLAAALARPTAPLATLPLIGEEEATAIAAALRGEQDPREPRCVHEIIATQAARTPHAIAVADDDGALSYADLLTRARTLAAALAAAGVTPDTTVALCMERSVALAVAMLGVLLAGGAYVPLDPALPLARRRYMATDSGARLLVTCGAPDQALAAGRQVIDLATLARDDRGFTSSAVTPAHAAYVLYTSGSTGEPKGVVVEHRQLCTYLRGALARLGIARPTSFALLSTVAADLGNTAVFGALASGGTLHMIAAARAADPEALAEYFDRHAIDGMKIVPSHLNALLASPAAARLLPRRCLVLGGEALGWPLIARVRALAPEVEIFNHYGPTETTVGCLCGAVMDEPHPGLSVPLGTPLANVELAIVDTADLPVPVGVTGELLIGGAGVARGYLNRPALDAERFTPPPTRRYRSGDLVRLRGDGRVEFVARGDDQLKVRGFRVEPGEVAASIATHAEVRDCAVLAQRLEDGEVRLVACVVPTSATLDLGALRAWLAARLPEYMLPSQWLVHDELPRTANDKVDRSALARRVEQAASTRSRGAAEIHSGTQGVIAGLFCEQLHLDSVRAMDKFFDLGGNSLAALQLVGRIKKATGVRVTPRDLLLQTVAQLATLIDQRATTGDSRSAG